VTTAARVQELPDVPTIADTIPGFEASGWSGVVAPKNTPKDVIDKLATAISAIQADPKFKDRLSEFGAPLFAMSPAEFGKFIVEETRNGARWSSSQDWKPQ